MYAWEAIRRWRGLSKEEVCRKADLDFVTLWKIYKGHTTKPHLRTVLKLARALNIHPSLVFKPVGELTPDEKKELDLL